ncbi:hypothetical protein FB451DRAFT_1409934 [Mycena latifolia]|nr:hypothetical protein FB451DRAFT_1409934 [Mycena latifolia]
MSPHVITRVVQNQPYHRKAFDSAGLETVNGFKLGCTAILAFALPAHVNTALRNRNVIIAGSSHPVMRMRQIEVNYAFEIAIGGVALLNPSAVYNIGGWFASFERNS